ncbi:MAG: L-threonylcarbamoyladenylate synthase [Clostridia bacterium]|nr:L-threonylcarbamoyladenylate synthase [Clostridia bacterium]
MSHSILRNKGTLLLGDDRVSVVRAARIIQNGGLVAFPTETVYGLGAAATDAQAVKRIFKAKGRPSDNPLIVHIADIEQLNAVVKTISTRAFMLAEHFWPGPLSLILPRADKIPAVVSAGLPTVAVRMPDHQVALDLIRAAKVPIAAPSANRSGRPSPTSFRHVLEDLAGRIDAVIRSDTCPIGLESTVLDLTGPRPVILRPGGVSREELEAVLNCRVPVLGLNKASGIPHSPGMKYRHYSPQAPLVLITGLAKRRLLLIESIVESYRRQGLSVGLLNSAIQEYMPLKAGPEMLAVHLYDSLRQMDHRDVDLILAEETEIQGLGLAVMNRLRKAATRILKV